jgi:hypothetical protein
MARVQVDPTILNLPRPALPMPGDEVAWYDEARPYTGRLLGHNYKGQPIVRIGREEAIIPDVTVPSYYAMRLKDHNIRVQPNWHRLPPHGKILNALPAEIDAFSDLLRQQIPPGPRYYEFISEIWMRGYEVYLVGGTVRDILAGQRSFDVDITTTMPLKALRPLVNSMFRMGPEGSPENGFIRIGGAPGSGDPFIDVKVFCHRSPGTKAAVFGSDFQADVAHRDFSCNSIYYDPVNKVFIDPTGRGVEDAINRQLHIVHDPSFGNSRYHQGTIAIRFFKFAVREFTWDEITQEFITTIYLPSLASMEKSRRIQYLRAQLMSKYPQDSHLSLFDAFGRCMCSFGATDQWQKYFEPLRKEVCCEN